MVQWFPDEQTRPREGLEERRMEGQSKDEQETETLASDEADSKSPASVQAGNTNQGSAERAEHTPSAPSPLVSVQTEKIHPDHKLVKRLTSTRMRRSLLSGVGLVTTGALATILGGLVLGWFSSPNSGIPVPRALVKLINYPLNAVIPDPISKVPVPPTYPIDEETDHCDIWWGNWFIREGASPDPPSLIIQVSAPVSADVTVIAARARIFHAYKPKATSFIECTGGGGPIPGTLLNIDLAHPDAAPTIVSDIGTAVPLSMPGAVINIDPGHTEYINVVPHGTGRFYDWSVELTVIVDQHTESIVLGSPQHPLRSWLGPIPRAGVRAGASL
jgi:hypothetical protein